MNQKAKEPDQKIRNALGVKIDHFPVRHLRIERWICLIIGGMMAAVALGFSVFHLINTMNAIAIHGRAVLLNRLYVFFTMLCLVVPLGMLLLIQAILHWRDAITLYQNGLIKQRGGHKDYWLYTNTVRFDTLVKFIKFAGSTVAVRARLLLEDAQNRKIILHNHYENMETLIHQIRLNVLPVLMAATYRRLADDEVLKFHKHLKASEDGLKIKDQFYPWTNQLSYEIKKGMLLIYTLNQTQILSKIKINQVKNLEIFIRLIETKTIPRG